VRHETTLARFLFEFWLRFAQLDRNRLSNVTGGYATVGTTTLDADQSTSRIVMA
jgi:hypothetical protein